MIHTARSTGKFILLVRWLRNQYPDLPVDHGTLAVGLLERLWHFTMISHRRGDIGKSCNDVIAEAVGWHGDPDDLICQLVDTKWLVEDDQHRLVVNDWAEHAPTHIKRNAHRWGGLIGQDDSSEQHSDSGERFSGDKTTQVSGLVATPNVTKRNVTKPNLTKPNERTYVTYVRPVEDNEIEEIVLRCETLKNAVDANPGRPLKPEDRELCWRAVVLEHAGLCDLTELMASVRRKPPGTGTRWGYFRGALKRAVEGSGGDFHQIYRSIELPVGPERAGVAS